MHYKPNGSAPLANHHFQMGITVMGFAEDFEHSSFITIPFLLIAAFLFEQIFNPKHSYSFLRRLEADLNSQNTKPNINNG